MLQKLFNSYPNATKYINADNAKHLTSKCIHAKYANDKHVNVTDGKAMTAKYVNANDVIIATCINVK